MGFQTPQNLDVFLIFLSVRLLSVIVTQTFFVADEYYQSLEVAHNLVFGYGQLTWEWKQGIRSYGYPLIFTVLYQLLKLLRLDTPLAIIYTPRIAQAFLSAYADLQLYRWTGAKKWAVFTIATSWFWFYTGSRTLINTFEADLTTIALSKFPWVGQVIDESDGFIWIVVSLFFIRPTSAVIWLPLCLYHLYISQKSAFRLIVTRYIPISLLVLVIHTAIDSWVHGLLIVTPYNFLRVNVFNNISSHYGTLPWHWYLCFGIPAVLGIQLLPFVLAVIVILKNRANHPNELAILGCIIFSVFILSLLGHKEFRFLLPLLPMMLYVTSKFLSAWSRKAHIRTIWLVSLIIFWGNAFPAWYLGNIHQTGTIDVMHELRDIATKDPENTSFIFLMPCHSTPFYSHLHINVTMRSLNCDPNLDNVLGYVDEADEFYANPNAWLRKNYPSYESLPSHLICFDTLLPAIGGDILTRYKKMKQLFHCNFPVTTKIGTHVLVFERKDFEIFWTTK